MAWTFLGIAIACEVLATTALKLSNGFSHAWWTIASVGGYAMAFVMLSLSVKGWGGNRYGVSNFDHCVQVWCATNCMGGSRFGGSRDNLSQCWQHNPRLNHVD
jgi:hypothetical protein